MVSVMERFSGMLKQKRAQFYILTAIMLIAYSAMLLQSDNVVPEASDAFRDAYDNFVFESAVSINTALFGQADIAFEYGRFMDDFISYSKMKKMDIGVFAVLEHGDYVHFINRMGNSVRVVNLNQTIAPDSEDYFLRSGLSDVVLEVRDDVFHENIYKFTISNQGSEAKAVLRMRKGSDREIFVMD